MTILQILALVILGPLGLIQLMYGVRAVTKGTEFHLAQAFALFACVALILVSFLGVS